MKTTAIKFNLQIEKLMVKGLPAIALVNFQQMHTLLEMKNKIHPRVYQSVQGALKSAYGYQKPRTLKFLLFNDSQRLGNLQSCIEIITEKYVDDFCESFDLSRNETESLVDAFFHSEVNHWGLFYWRETSYDEKNDLARVNLELAREVISKKIDEMRPQANIDAFAFDIESCERFNYFIDLQWWSSYYDRALIGIKESEEEAELRAA